MDDRFLDTMAEVFQGEQDRWGLRCNKAEKRVWQVYRHDDSGLGGSFSHLYPFDDLEEAETAAINLSNRAAARAVLEGVLDGVAELVEEFRVNLDDERRAQDQIAALIRAQMIHKGE